MACLQRLCRFTIKNCLQTTRRLSTQQIQNVGNFNLAPVLAGNLIKNPWIWQKPTSIESPIANLPAIELPKSITWLPITDNHEKTVIKDPQLDINKYEKRAAKLIVIRRHKMRKHKLQKLRKKMKFEWAKLRQRREMRKEKAFQAELLAQIKEAENFSAQQFVAEKLRQATEVPIPRFWKGKRLPEFLIREKLGLPPK